MSHQEIEIECLRYDPERDHEPRFQSWRVPFRDDMSVLQGLQYIKDHLDGSLSFRWSCRMAICGSCGHMLNGVPQLSCHAFLRDYFPGKLRIEPLQHFPIVRDLVVDQSDFLDKLESVKPWLMPRHDKPLAEGAHRQTPQQMAKYLRVFAVHQLPAVLRRLSAIRLGQRLHRPGRTGAAASLQRRFARRRLGSAQ